MTQKRPRPVCRLCDRTLSRGHFLCVEHWQKLDASHRDAITAAVAENKAEQTGDSLRRLWAAQDAALETIEVRL